MTRFIIITSFLLCSILYSSSLKSQYYFYDDNYFDSPIIFEIGLSAGGMNCLTDLGGKKGTGRKFMTDVNWNATKACGSLYAGATYHSIISAYFEFSLGRITANDNVLKNGESASYGRFVRNLEFHSNISEASLHFEFHPLSLINGFNPAFSPYLLTGIGCYSFSPQAYFNNTWIALSDLHTEGQGFLEYINRQPYKLTQLNLPIGIGLKYEVSAIFNLRVDMIYRKLWTDYLDDVSKTYVDPAKFGHYLPASEAELARKFSDRRIIPASNYSSGVDSKRGNDKNNDAYFSFSVKTGLLLGRQRRN